MATSKSTKAEAPKRGLPGTHPGELLRDIILPALKEKGVSKLAVAAALGVSRRGFENILLQESAVTPEMALRLGRYFGNAPEFWLNMQTAFDLAAAQVRLKDELEKIEPLPKDLRPAA